MLQSNRVPETQRPEEACLHPHFHRGLRPNPIDREEMRELVASRWADLVRKLPPKNCAVG
jgi:hypothetical protein